LQQYTPPTVRPAPILPTVPTPVFVSPEPIGVTSPSAKTPADEVALLLGGDGPVTPAAGDLLLTPHDSTPAPAPSDSAPFASSTALPAATPSPARPAAEAAPQASFLQNSAAVQEELSQQLAQMAAQLRRNAQHFGASLEKDRHVVAAAAEKVERNLDVLTTQRVRVRDRGVSGRGSTCFLVVALIGVVIAFAAMVLLIRFT
jgi:hypothetical protein